MEALIGQHVKIFFNASFGVTVTSGKFVKIEDDFVIIDTEQGPEFIPISNVKMIKAVKDND